MKGLLTGNLPTSFQIGDKEYKISSDFRVMLELEEIFSSECTNAEKGEAALRLFYGCIPEDVDKAVEKLCFFWQGGKTESKKQGRRAEVEENRPPVYSLTHDAGLLYAAFLTQYGVDLTEDSLHWWKFLALLEGLEDERMLKEVMRCRAVDITADMPQAQKDYYKAMKQRYALPLPEAIERQLSALEAALMGDGNVSEVMKCHKK